MLELADAIVLGGGILGTAVTAALSRRLSRVLLLEAGRCGSGATGSGFAWVNASSKLGDETYHRLNADACKAHLALAAEWEAARTGWHGGGSLAWASASDEAALNALEARIHGLQSLGYPVARLTSAEMQALEPHVRFEQDAVGLFAPGEGWVSTQRLVRFYVDQARERQATVSEYTNVTGFVLDHRGGVAGVETSGGRVATRALVLCAGAETGRLAQALLGRASQPVERMVTRAPGLLTEFGPLPEAARVQRVCYPPSEYGFHMRPTEGGGLLLGADDTDAMCGQAPTDLPGGEAMLTRRAAGTLPGFGGGGAATSRVCDRPMPFDGLPIVGDFPYVPGAYILLSHSAVTLAPLLAELLADEIVTGRRSARLAPYRPERVVS